MSDPISGDAMRQVSKAAEEISQTQQDQAKSTDKTQFEDVLQDKVGQDEQVKKVLETDLQTQIDKIPHTEKVRLERELETRVLKMDRADQSNYFAVKIEQSEQSFLRLREQSGQIDDGPWKTKLTDTLGNYESDFAELNSFMKEFASGKEFSQKELLAIQLRSHQIVQSVEIMSKTVEQSVSGMKTIFQTNV